MDQEYFVYYYPGHFEFFQLYYQAKYGEKLIPSLLRRVFHPPEETEEVVTSEEPVKKLTVNPDFDGTNKEFVYSDASDDEAVVRIWQTITYQYYDDKGNAIETVETQSINARGETLYSGYKRGSCKMSDTSITRQEKEIIYRYEADTIYRECIVSLFAGENCVSSSSSSSEINRT